MNKKSTGGRGEGVSRRDFLQGAAAVSAAALTTGFNPNLAMGAGSDALKVGLIGCGGRGTGAAGNCVASANGVQLYAMGDLFKDRLEGSRGKLARAGKVPDDRCFVGFDAFQKVIGCGVDMVILATPPHFRPQHLKAAIEAGKHVFMEKPVAVDPVGIRSVIASSELARQKKLGIVAGTQRRHQAGYVETMKRIRGGAIGKVVAAQCYWNSGTLWLQKRKPGWSDMEYQVRNWLYYAWLSGDHIVEQHVHNIDVVNWAIGTHPQKAMGMGGREVRTEKQWGNIYDHFAIEFEYPGGVRVLSMCRQMRGTSNRVSEKIVGTKGMSNPRGEITGLDGESIFSFKGRGGNPYVQEHADLIAGVRKGKPLNEGRQVAESTMAAIMGRMSAYTGREISWDWAMKASKLDLSPKEYKFGPIPTRPIAVPGKTKLI